MQDVYKFKFINNLLDRYSFSILFFHHQKFEWVSLYLSIDRTLGDSMCQLATNFAVNARSCIRIRKRYNLVSFSFFLFFFFLCFLSLYSQMYFERRIERNNALFYIPQAASPSSLTECSTQIRFKLYIYTYISIYTYITNDIYMCINYCFLFPLVRLRARARRQGGASDVIIRSFDQRYRKKMGGLERTNRKSFYKVVFFSASSEFKIKVFLFYKRLIQSLIRFKIHYEFFFTY